MDTLSALLALCVGIHQLLVDSHKGPIMQSFDGFLVVSMDKFLNDASSGLWTADTADPPTTHENMFWNDIGVYSCQIMFESGNFLQSFSL